MERKNLDDARDYARDVVRQNNLISQNSVAAEDRILFIDRSEFYEQAQPKQTSLSGLAQSIVNTPEFQSAVLNDVKAYGSFFDTTQQNNAGVGQVNFMQYDSTVIAGGVFIASGTRIVVPNSGVYDIQFSAQLDKTGAGVAHYDIWLVKNNSNVAWSNTRVHLESSSHDEQVAAWNFVVSGVPGDNFQLAWAADNADAYLAAFSGFTNPTRPDVPSVILSINQH